MDARAKLDDAAAVLGFENRMPPMFSTLCSGRNSLNRLSAGSRSFHAACTWRSCKNLDGFLFKLSDAQEQVMAVLSNIVAHDNAPTLPTTAFSGVCPSVAQKPQQFVEHMTKLIYIHINELTTGCVKVLVKHSIARETARLLFTLLGNDIHMEPVGTLINNLQRAQPSSLSVPPSCTRLRTCSASLRRASCRIRSHEAPSGVTAALWRRSRRKYSSSASSPSPWGCQAA